MFYDYYTPRAGQLCGQYIVVPLSDFDGKPLHARTPQGAFKLRLNRTEVVRRKAMCVLPIFPLKKRYNLANYSLEGQGGAAIDVPNQGYDDVPDDDTRTAATEDVVYDSQLYDYVLPASKLSMRFLSLPNLMVKGLLLNESIQPNINGIICQSFMKA